MRRSYERRQRIAELVTEAHRLAAIESHGPGGAADPDLIRFVGRLGFMREEAEELCESALRQSARDRDRSC